MTSRSIGTYVIAAAFFSSFVGATCNGKQVARNALDVAEMSCVLFHEDIQDEAALARACDIAEALIPELRKLLAAKKSAAQKKAALKADAGTP